MPAAAHFDECLAQRVLPQPDVGHAERAAGAVIVVGPALLVLGALEVGQHVLIRPADIAELTPHVEILRLSPHVEQAVDGAGAAEHAAARPGDRAAIEMGLGAGAELPGHGRVGEVAVVAGGDVDPGVAVASAGLDKSNLDAGVLAQAVGQHAACRARTDNDIVEFAAIHPVRSPISRCRDCRSARAAVPSSRGRGVAAGLCGAGSAIVGSGPIGLPRGHFWRPIGATIRRTLWASAPEA
jgi:hypothetical protein